MKDKDIEFLMVSEALRRSDGYRYVLSETAESCAGAVSRCRRWRRRVVVAAYILLIPMSAAISTVTMACAPREDKAYGAMVTKGCEAQVSATVAEVLNNTMEG